VAAEDLAVVDQQPAVLDQAVCVWSLALSTCDSSRLCSTQVPAACGTGKDPIGSRHGHSQPQARLDEATKSTCVGLANRIHRVRQYTRLNGIS
jgi:hypothetical protein